MAFEVLTEIAYLPVKREDWVRLPTEALGVRSGDEIDHDGLLGNRKVVSMNLKRLYGRIQPLTFAVVEYWHT